MNNYGLIIEPPKPEDYVLGGKVSLKGEVLAPDGQWDGYLPETEVQNRNNVEPYSCVSFTTNNCIEILERRLFGARDNWSDRFLASLSGTKERMGNTPNNVAETRRKKGCVKEEVWPVDSTIDSFDKYYAPVPQNIQTMAIGEGAQYAFGYEYVPLNVESIKEALLYSPVGFSAYAWAKDENGLFYRPQGLSDIHFCTCYGYEEGKYWKIFDSYLDDGMILKKVRWDSVPMMAMRYTLNKQVVVPSAWDKFISLLKEILGL